MYLLAPMLNESENLALCVCTIWISVCLVISAVITIHALSRLCPGDASEWINNTYRILTILIMLASTMNIAVDLAQTLVSFYVLQPQSGWNEFESPSDFRLALIAWADILYFFGDLLFYTLILLRIHIPFELHRATVLSLSLLICVSGIVSTAYCICLFVIYEHKYDRYWTAMVVVLSSNDVILNAFISTVFVQKMRRTILSINPSLFDEEAAKKVNLISNVVTKHCILFGIAIFVNQGYFASQFYLNMADGVGVIAGDLVPAAVRSVENAVNVLVMWLILRINYNKYICLCKPCHLCVGRCCFRNSDFRKSVTVHNPYHQLQIQNL